MNLKDYIKGERHGEAANRLEREAMEDPFLQGAIDGYDSVEGDHYSVIQKLEQQLTQPRKRVNRRVWIAAAAALLLLLIGIPFLLHPPQQMAEPLIATTNTGVEEEAVEEKTEPLEEIVVAQAVETTKEHEVLETAQATEAIETTRATGRVKVTEEAAHEYESVPALALAQQPSRSAVPDTSRKRDYLLVSGRLLDETGEPVVGATIFLENSTSATVSGTDGKFSLAIPKGGKGTLIASFVGMHNETIPLKEDVGDITMKEDVALLSEVTVVAFGTQEKEDLVGSTATSKQAPTRIDYKALDQRGKEVAEKFEVDETTTIAFGKKRAEAKAPREIKSTKESGKRDTEAVVFGEKEFKEYFLKHYDKSLCQGQPIAFTVTFSIRSDGLPTGVQIQRNSCPDLETEIKLLLLGSPLWTNTNRKVTLTVEIPGS